MRQRNGFLSRLTGTAIALAVVGSLAHRSASGDDRAPQIPELKVETYTLPNGLQVILHEDHVTPSASVNLWYRVGSKNEKIGRTGFAHLFEHLMFQGSKDHDNEYFGPIEKVGAEINGSTSTDRTNYFETLPSNALELALWLEADRMGFLLPALTQAKLDNQRDVVKNERRQSVDNVPYGQAAEKLEEALYPPDHPYHHSVIGSMADLSAASLDDVSAFFRTYYAPNNASLVIAGDIDVAKTKALVEKYFGPIPAGPKVAKLEPWIPKLDAPQHLTMTDKVTLPRASLVWPTVARGDKDEPAIDVLAAILGDLPKDSRLYKALMYDRQLAASVSAQHPTAVLSGTFEVELSARPKQSLDEVVSIAEAEIERLKKDGPTDAEVVKAQNFRESGQVLGLQSLQHRADFLNEYNTTFGDPLAYKAETKALFAVTAADVKRVANRFLTANRIRLDVNPGQAAVRAPEVAVDPKSQAPIASPPVIAIKDTFDRSKMPAVAAPPRFAPPPVVRRKLSNGLPVLITERHDLPVLSLELVVKGGETLVPAEKHGLAGMTASLLSGGTKTLDALQLASAFGEIGSTLTARGGAESSTVSLTTLTKHTERALELFTDVLLNPTFPEKEVERVRLERLAAIQARTDSAQGIGTTVYPRVLYGEAHPYGRPRDGSLKSIKELTRDDVVAFHKRLYAPGNAALVVVGDTTPDAITAMLEKALKEWTAPSSAAIAPPKAPPQPEAVTVYLVDKPGAAQSLVMLGEIGVPRKTKDYIPLTVMNAVLGGEFSSRLNLNLREDKGYSYGVQSQFVFRLGPGPFVVGTSVQTAATKESVAEILKELTDVTGPRTITQKELDFAKDRLIRGFPGQFETTGEVAGALAELVVFDLPDDEYTTYTARVEAVTKADVDRVARTYLHPDRLTMLIVGDRATIEGPLKTLPYAKVINLLDNEGNPLAGTKETGEKDVK